VFLDNERDTSGRSYVLYLDNTGLGFLLYLALTREGLIQGGKEVIAYIQRGVNGYSVKLGKLTPWALM
jgi:hypothetical protein